MNDNTGDTNDTPNPGGMPPSAAPDAGSDVPATEEPAMGGEDGGSTGGDTGGTSVPAGDATDMPSDTGMGGDDKPEEPGM